MRRHPLRKKECSAIADEILASCGAEVDERNFEIVEGKGLKMLKNGEIFAFYVDEKPVLTVRGALRFMPSKKRVTVDMGAVGFITNGADVMSPGITDADPGIKKGDIVYILDEKNKKVISVGRALLDGEDISRGDRSSRRGKAVKNLHYAGDHIWNF